MNLKKILITGANGYIGKHVVNYLAKNFCHEIIAIDITSFHTEKYIKTFQYDILNLKCEDLFNEIGIPDIVIHLAWQNGFNHNALSHLESLNKHYEFIKNLIDKNVESISVMGTMHEVGYFEGEINATTPTNPMSLYGIAKNSLRQAVLTYARNKNTSLKWLRAFYIMGDDMNSNSIFSKILNFEKENKKTFPFTSGKNKYDFIKIEDLAKQIVSASVQNEIDGIINCCSGIPMALKDIVEDFIKKEELKIKPEYGAFPDREYDSPCIYGSTNLINMILNS